MGVKMMSKYTTDVRSICENLAGYEEHKGFGDIDTVIDQAIPEIFNFDYPIFDEKYRTALEHKILEHFYTKEIAHESVGLWRFSLRKKMREIMPYYNQRYESTLLTFNPFYDTDSTHNRTVTNNGQKVVNGTNVQGTVKKETGTVGNSETLTNTGTVKNVGTSTNTGTVKNSGTVKDSGTVIDDNVLTNNLKDITKTEADNVKTTTTDNKDKYSDTPQGSLSNVEKDTYLTNYRNIEGENVDHDVIDNTETITKSGTANNKNTKTNNLTTTNDLTVTNNLTNGSDLTTTNNLTNQRNNTLTNNLTTDIDDTLDIHSTDTINNTETYVETVMGKQGLKSYSSLLIEFRDTFLNIDMEIIDELSELFHNLW
jgi:hypothetical protein